MTGGLAGELVEVGQGEGNLQPIMPMAGVIGEMGRTPIPVAESTVSHPKEKSTPQVGYLEGRKLGKELNLWLWGKPGESLLKEIQIPNERRG